MIRVIICGYNCNNTIRTCERSVDMQVDAEYTKHISIDCNDDRNIRKYLLRNTVDTINSIRCDDEDIIVEVNADDFLCDEMAFKIIEQKYKNHPELLLTYGSYVNFSSNKTGKFCKKYEEGESFRTSSWRASHLKTFKYKLFKNVHEGCYLDDNGAYLRCCADRAMMIPMMEMAGHDRISHIPMILYCYNDINPISVWNTMKAESKKTREMIASGQPLNRVEDI